MFLFMFMLHLIRITHINKQTCVKVSRQNTGIDSRERAFVTFENTVKSFIQSYAIKLYVPLCVTSVGNDNKVFNVLKYVKKSVCEP